jgi:hypothetical protein
MAEPKIFSKNYVSADCTFAESHTSGTVARLYDRDNSAQYVTSGANSDATEASIEVTFKENTTAVSRTFTNIMVLNHNLKSLWLDYWNGSSWVAITSASGLAVTNSVYSFSSITASKFRIRATLTQTTNVEKLIGELIACNLTLDIGTELDSYDVSWRQKANELEMGDGSFHRTVVPHSTTRSTKYEATARFTYLTTTTLLALRAIREAGLPFLWQPESSERPDQIFYVHWIGNERTHYASPYKGAGHILEMNLREA